MEELQDFKTDSDTIKLPSQLDKQARVKKKRLFLHHNIAISQVEQRTMQAPSNRRMSKNFSKIIFGSMGDTNVSQSEFAAPPSANLTNPEQRQRKVNANVVNRNQLHHNAMVRERMK